MNPFRTLAAALAISTGLLTLSNFAMASENTSGNPEYDVEAPKAYTMIGDLLIARPALIFATVVGAGLFVVTLPFSAAGGNIGEAGHALVVEPGAAAFVRCLGCTESGYKRADR
ncbi:multidrug transporter [Pseudomonas sp. LRF_L74]|uniref:multidrug transporter n=1 Tax=Pseudomonas sp. LRF_L74 TaxID=3369422 RepID=UPI003F5ECC20